MKVSVQIEIQAKPAEVWNVITDIENSINFIRGIEEIEIHHKPESGLVGLRWKETRTMFGKTATEVMWVTDAVEKKSYSVRAESHGSAYLTDFRIEAEGNSALLISEFRSEPQTVMAKFMNFIFSRMLRKMSATGLMDDLEDIKKKVESGG